MDIYVRVRGVDARVPEEDVDGFWAWVLAQEPEPDLDDMAQHMEEA